MVLPIPEVVMCGAHCGLPYAVETYPLSPKAQNAKWEDTHAIPPTNISEVLSHAKYFFSKPWELQWNRIVVYLPVPIKDLHMRRRPEWSAPEFTLISLNHMLQAHAGLGTQKKRDFNCCQHAGLCKKAFLVAVAVLICIKWIRHWRAIYIPTTLGYSLKNGLLQKLQVTNKIRTDTRYLGYNEHKC